MDELWVVWPDGYVGLVARRDDAAAAELISQALPPEIPRYTAGL
jgi:hypothetical protein